MVPGSYEISIADAPTARIFNFKRAPSLYRPENIYQFIKQLNETYAQNQLILEIWTMKKSLVVQGTEFSRVPGSFFQVLGSTAQSGASTKLKNTLILLSLKVKARLKFPP